LGKKTREERAELPPARAGILSFWDEEAPGYRVDPDHVIYACFLIAAVLAILHVMAYA
jgi:preprotein translocase subunit Sec61beta